MIVVIVIGCCLVVRVVGKQAAVLFPALQVVATVRLVDTNPWRQVVLSHNMIDLIVELDRLEEVV